MKCRTIFLLLLILLRPQVTNIESYASYHKKNKSNIKIFHRRKPRYGIPKEQSRNDPPENVTFFHVYNHRTSKGQDLSVIIKDSNTTSAYPAFELL